MEELLERLYNGESGFTTDELADFVYETDRVGQEEGDDRRWFRSITVYFKYKDKYFGINYDHGLTENQDDEFWQDPFEVIPTTETKTIEITTYNPVK